jgi:hypothetical protein
VPEAELCNARDDDCNELVDEQGACPSGCTAFSYDGRGYMLCDGAAKRSWLAARTLCEAEAMRIVWIQSASENAAIRSRAQALPVSTSIYLGGYYSAADEAWMWDTPDAGIAFWSGDEGGDPVDGAYENWDFNRPSNSGANYCFVMQQSSAAWRDTDCTSTRAFVCEEPEPESEP